MWVRLINLFKYSTSKLGDNVAPLNVGLGFNLLTLLIKVNCVQETIFVHSGNWDHVKITHNCSVKYLTKLQNFIYKCNF